MIDLYKVVFESMLKMTSSGRPILNQQVEVVGIKTDAHQMGLTVPCMLSVWVVPLEVVSLHSHLYFQCCKVIVDL